MPHLTPSRLLILVLSCFLVLFFWTYGAAPQQPAPVIVSDVTPNRGGAKPLDNPPVPYPPEHALPSEDLVNGDTVKGGDGAPAAPESAEIEKPPGGGAGKGKAKGPTPTTLKTEALFGQPTDAPSSFPEGSSKSCRNIRGASDVVLVLRTSRAEIHDKLPAHLKTLFDCVPNVAIYSDHRGTVNGYTIHDTLDVISPNTSKHYDEFREYDKIHSEKNFAPSVERTKELDKWKFLPMVYKTYRSKPDARWYMFIEKDTSLSWTNLLQWLDRLDYRIPYYSGAPMYKDETRFAQHGPGILLSYGALRQYAKIYDEQYASAWESHVGEACCGDQVLGQAMTESAVEFYPAFPLLQEATPGTVDWTQGHWCVPLVSWHGMTVGEADRLWELHQAWTEKNGWDVPYLIRNAFEDLMLPYLTERKDYWDNISSDTVIYGEKKQTEPAQENDKPENPKESDDNDAHEGSRLGAEPPILQKAERPPLDNDETGHPHRQRRDDKIDWDTVGQSIKDAAASADKCMALCARTEDCLQWKFTRKAQGECHLGKTLRLGKSSGKKDKAGPWTSGWMVDRVKDVTQGWGECDKVNWNFHQG